MNAEQAAEIVWSGIQQGLHFPEELQGQLNLHDALAAQLGVLTRRKAAGERHGGWKMGQTSFAIRERNGSDEQAFGHIMAHRIFSAGATIPLAEIGECGVEPELCFTMGATLQGPGITVEQVRAAVQGVSPGFELNQRRSGKGKGFYLSVADNLSQWGIVVGRMVAPVPPDMDWDALRVEMRCNGELRATSVGREVIDDHYESLAKLANLLGEHGVPLEAGHRIITGSFSKHDVSLGDTWEATFEGIGTVGANFA